MVSIPLFEGFLKWGYPQSSSISRGIFPNKNHAANLGYPQSWKPPFLGFERYPFDGASLPPQGPQVKDLVRCVTSLKPTSRQSCRHAQGVAFWRPRDGHFFSEELEEIKMFVFFTIWIYESTYDVFIFVFKFILSFFWFYLMF